MKTLFIGFCMFALFANSYGSGPYQATGIKICEVDQTSAIVWMRLPEHRYLNVIGGFLEGVVERENDIPVLIFRHFGVDGDLLNEDRLVAQH